MYFNPIKILKGLLWIIFILLILNLLSFINLHINNLGLENYFFKKTSFSLEKNLPSTFSSLLHLFASFLLASIALSKAKIKPRKWFWWGLSFIFFFLFLDELLRIHERIGGYSFIAKENLGFYMYGWILYYAAGLIFISLFMFRPFLQLPKTTIKRFMVSGGIFLIGAIGLENIAGAYILENSIIPGEIDSTPIIFVLSTLEELFEMVGVSYFIYSILIYRKNVAESEMRPKVSTWAK